MTNYDPDEARLGLASGIPGAETPPDVQAALDRQNTLHGQFREHFDRFEHVLVDDWQDRAEAAMIMHAAANEPYERLLDERRVQRVAAITRWRELAAQTHDAARTARTAVRDWLATGQPLAAARQAETEARAAETEALAKLDTARRRWMAAAATRQWHEAAAVAPATSLPQMYGQPLGPGGTNINVARLDALRDAIASEHRRAEAGAKAVGRESVATAVGTSGIEFRAPRSTVEALVASGSARFLDGNPEAAAG